MTVVGGRGRSGARSALRACVFGAFAAVGLFASGCGNDVVTYGIPVITMSVTPGPFKAYIVEIDGITLTRTDGTQTNLFGTNSVSTVERIDLAKSTDLDELWGAPALLTGTYTSATITIDYTSAQIAVDIGGNIYNPLIEDPTGVTAGVETYTIKFDPAHPLVITQGELTPINLNFDLNAGTIVVPGSSPLAVEVRPYLSMDTAPVYTKPMRARGLSVTTDPANLTFTMNSRPFYDDASNPFGAITMQTTATTPYNVNGVNLVGAAGLAAIATLPINTTLAAFGTLSGGFVGTGTSTTPVFQVSQVIAGTSFENLAADRVIGTVASRTATTLTLQGAELATRPGEIVSDAATTQIINYFQNFTVDISDSTVVAIDGQPNTNATIQNISIGQQVDLNGQAIPDATTGVFTSIDATNPETGGVVRLTSTPVWGALNQAPANGQLSLTLVSLGQWEPSVFTFTGTGSATGADADPAAYLVDTNTNGINTSALAAGSVVRVDGNVTAYGAAPPDFIATAVTPAGSTEQVLVVDYIAGGAPAPFSPAASASGLTVDLSNPELGPTHEVLTGPYTFDLTTVGANVTIVPTATAQFSIGDPADNTVTGLLFFNSFSGFLTQLSTSLTGNTLEKIVAVGTYDQTSNTFSATRVNIVTWQ
jgi:hypothetical protein